MYRLSFRIRRIYFDQIVKGEKKSEIRRASRFWKIRASHAQKELFSNKPVVAVFVCGKKVHRQKLWAIWWFSNAEKALGRKPSPQGKKDLGRGGVFKFSWLGETK